ncbi:MAG: energy-coupling factor ABC transporter ATP-binding protein [Methanofollis sp.]|uniref:energy-coupling factor ABC transporter ATP-binding protein n=1 Tax=Methanofollis sp. TaxID=2052835 RepID=UPI00260A7453|nr:energy-coupling factor ABC transporter ATP-binding protein [Methanofollis sp.]MDD4255551.1 energy-coupling factor ABC transporter ATP-binding protein [Methanofollis sp.]
MDVRLDSVLFRRGAFTLTCSGVFGEGVHLVSGRVGSGKTTLALLLAGLIRPSAGTVTREGIESLTLSFQNPEYHVTEATVEAEVLSYGADPVEIAKICGLEDRLGDDPFALSRGELKRLHLACILSGRHNLLVLDEPFSSLDCVQKGRLCRELNERKGGVTVIFTHERQVLPRADYLWEVEEGEVVSLGRVPDAIPAWRHAPPYLRHALDAGVVPENIRFRDAVEALCRTHD